MAERKKRTGKDLSCSFCGKGQDEQHNLMIPLKDRVLADKAMDLIYDNAKVTSVPPAAQDAQDA